MSEQLNGVKLSEVRKVVSLSQNGLSAASGIPQPSIAFIEGGKRDIKLSTLKRYVEGTGCKLSIEVTAPSGEVMKLAL